MSKKDETPVTILVTVTDNKKRASVIVEHDEPLSEQDFLDAVQLFLRESDGLSFDDNLGQYELENDKTLN